MIGQNEIEEIIWLIHEGFDLNLISFELQIPMEQIEQYKKRLELRKFVKDSIKYNRIAEAMDKLRTFLENTEDSIVEKTMLLKLNAYVTKTNVSEESLAEIEEVRERIGLFKSIDEILERLSVQIPRRKNINIGKKDQKNERIETAQEEQPQEVHEQEDRKVDYEKRIRDYQEKIKTDPVNAKTSRNLLAFTYFEAGMIKEARAELIAIIKDTNSNSAYRQIVHLEKSVGNLEEAKLWAYEGIDAHPQDIRLRQQLISIAKEEDSLISNEDAKMNKKEINEQSKEINKINQESLERLRDTINKKKAEQKQKVENKKHEEEQK